MASRLSLASCRELMPSRLSATQQEFFFFFFFGGRDIHYKDAMKETTSVCEGHPQQKLQATRTT